MSDLASLAGVAEVIEWFGHWPSFHYAQIRPLELVRDGPSRLVVETSPDLVR